ncbi:ATP-binding cassette domain-containing protein [Aquibacillus halophilus]|uniref:ATP-binding cassette domain-containing protein n=1 Tax=Aquibacillus halophilus TaxID=930132 RepID=A0A6A8DRE3_9BACI|nr:ABC transporter ATP-binding protein [Aquibacillus halophilus]MRH43772.1 ATP-binding cassette domain-containing protein [Aquibacillus halophilus]
MVLHLENVSLIREGKWILKDINWKINKGENWVLLGLNGAGKTALLHMLCAYYFPSKGNVTVLKKRFGKDPLGEDLRKRIGIVSSTLQDRIYGEDSAYQIVLSGAFASIGLYQTPTNDMRERAKQLLKELGCFDYANRSYRTLSQGEKQRVLIGRALMANPKFLILDEPTIGLDFIAREQLLEAIDRIANYPNPPSILYVTHHIEEILPCFDKTLLLKEGGVFASGRTSELLTKSTLTNFFEVPVDIEWHRDRPLLSKTRFS